MEVIDLLTQNKIVLEIQIQGTRAKTSGKKVLTEKAMRNRPRYTGIEAGWNVPWGFDYTRRGLQRNDG